MESGGPETAPASTPKCVVPLMSPEGCFHAATTVIHTIMEEGEARVAAVLTLSTCVHCYRSEQQTP